MSFSSSSLGGGVPEVVEFTPEQVQWAAGKSGKPDHFLLVQFQLEPGTRPRIHIPDSQRLPHPRGPQSICYLDALISNYLLHPDYFHRYADRLSGIQTGICLVQTGDSAYGIESSIGFCARDARVKLIPDPHFWEDRGYFNLREEFRKLWIPWQDRKAVAFWRGSSTGQGALTVESVQTLPRFRLCTLSTATSASDFLDAKLTAICQARTPEDEARIRSFGESHGVMGPPINQTDFIRYRYQIDIDGNSNSWSLLIKLLMGSCVLKVQSDFAQWYYDDLQPWKHYIPVKADLSDLGERIGWCRQNDEDARHIAENGKRYANGIVFGTEMTRAADRFAEASLPSIDSPPLSQTGSPRASHAALPVDQ
jgi:hypothetical protein